MGRKSEQTTDEPQMIDAGDAFEPESRDQDELRALAELGDNAEIKFQIYRTFPVNQAGYLEDMTAAELTLAEIRQRFGAGKYRVRALRANGQYVRQTTIQIADVRRPESAIQSPAPASGQTMTFMEMLTYMQQRDAERSARMKEWAAILVPALAPILPQLFSGNRAPSLSELTATLANMKNLSGSESGISKVKELAELLAVVKELQPEQPEKGTTWPDLIRDGLKELAPAIGALSAARAGVPRPMVLDNPRPENPALESAPIQPSEGDMLILWLREQMTALTFQASKNKDPALYADVVIDNIPDGANSETLLEFLKRPDWWQLLKTFYPDAAPYEAWFINLRVELIVALEEIISTMRTANKTAAPKTPPKAKVKNSPLSNHTSLDVNSDEN